MKRAVCCRAERSLGGLPASLGSRGTELPLSSVLLQGRLSEWLCLAVALAGADLTSWLGLRPGSSPWAGVTATGLLARGGCCPRTRSALLARSLGHCAPSRWVLSPPASRSARLARSISPALAAESAGSATRDRAAPRCLGRCRPCGSCGAGRAAGRRSSLDGPCALLGGWWPPVARAPRQSCLLGTSLQQQEDRGNFVVLQLNSSGD